MHAFLVLCGHNAALRPSFAAICLRVVQPKSNLEAIALARAALARCQLDEQGCGLGLRRLRAYRKGWDESRKVWKDRARQDEASHGAGAVLTFARSGYTPPSPTCRGRSRARRRLSSDDAPPTQLTGNGSASA